MTAPVRMTVDSGVAHIVLARPERCNALSDDLLMALGDAISQAAAADPRVMVLCAEGSHFSTGGDVARFAAEAAAGNGLAYAARTVGALNEVILALVALPCPVIAEIRGAVTGGALGLVLACDLVAMTPDAFIQPWYAEVGFAPDGGWTAMLPARIGAARARAAMLLNRKIGADEALALGIADGVADDADMLVSRWLMRLAAHDRASMAATKRLIASGLSLRVMLDDEMAAFLELIDRPETQARMAAFLGRSKEAAP